MLLEEKIAAFIRLGETIDRVVKDEKNRIFREAENENPWFIFPFVKMAFSGIRKFLTVDNLQEWTRRYSFRPEGNKKIGLVLAGNIPLVGFHDLLCVLLSGHHACLKLSHNDSVLMHFIVDMLIEADPRFGKRINLVEKVEEPDAVIATGSDNSSRYFLAHYQRIPHLIRKNRVSVAVLDGTESRSDLEQLSDDLFLYFGLGCRNVSKLFIPDNYDPAEMLRGLVDRYGISLHRKFQNNYRYQQAMGKVLDKSCLDGGFFLLERSDKLVSPVGVLYYSLYSGMKELKTILEINKEKIQAIVSEIPGLEGAVPFGQAQFPDPWDYSDRVDTMEFLLNL